MIKNYIFLAFFLFITTFSQAQSIGLNLGWSKASVHGPDFGIIGQSETGFQTEIALFYGAKNDYTELTEIKTEELSARGGVGYYTKYIGFIAGVGYNLAMAKAKILDSEGAYQTQNWSPYLKINSNLYQNLGPYISYDTNQRIAVGLQYIF